MMNDEGLQIFTFSAAEILNRNPAHTLRTCWLPTWVWVNFYYTHQIGPVCLADHHVTLLAILI